jgi:hypothetical protein
MNSSDGLAFNGRVDMNCDIPAVLQLLLLHALVLNLFSRKKVSGRLANGHVVAAARDIDDVQPEHLDP